MDTNDEAERRKQQRAEQLAASKEKRAALAAARRARKAEIAQGSPLTEDEKAEAERKRKRIVRNIETEQWVRSFGMKMQSSFLLELNDFFNTLDWVQLSYYPQRGSDSGGGDEDDPPVVGFVVTRLRALAAERGLSSAAQSRAVHAALSAIATHAMRLSRQHMLLYKRNLWKFSIVHDSLKVIAELIGKQCDAEKRARLAEDKRAEDKRVEDMVSVARKNRNKMDAEAGAAATAAPVPPPASPKESPPPYQAFDSDRSLSPPPAKKARVQVVKADKKGEPSSSMAVAAS